MYTVVYHMVRLYKKAWIEIYPPLGYYGISRLTEAIPGAVPRVTGPARTTEATAGGQVRVRALSRVGARAVVWVQTLVWRNKQTCIMYKPNK